MTDTVEDVVARLRAAGKAAVDAIDAEDAVDVCNEAEDLYPLAADLLTSEHAARVAAERERDHTQYWYAVRLERIKDLAKEKCLWTEVAAIIANATLTGAKGHAYEPPTYAQQLNSALHRASAAEARQAQLLEALREVVTVRDRAAFARARTLIKEMEGNG
jgi:hypothetical protein